MVVIEAAKASRVDIELGSKKLAIKVAKASTIMRKELPLIKDTEKEVLLANFN